MHEKSYQLPYTVCTSQVSAAIQSHTLKNLCQIYAGECRGMHGL